MARRKNYNDPAQTSVFSLFDADAFMNDLKDVIANAIIEKGRSATGRAVESLEVVKNSEEQFQIMAVSYLDKIEKGNKPTSGNRHVGKSKYMEPAVQIIASRLKEGWLQSRGLSEDLAYPIAQSLVKNGDRVYQQGGEDVWSSAVMQFIDDNIDQYLNVEQYLNLNIID